MLVADGDYRGWREVVSDEHGDYERALEQAVLLLSAGLADPAGLVVRTGPLVVDLLASNAWLSGRRLALTAHEWALLEILARHVGRVVPRSVVVDWLWSEPRHASSLLSLTQRLRARLEAAGPLVVTAMGVGLMLEDVPAEVA